MGRPMPLSHAVVKYFPMRGSRRGLSALRMASVVFSTPSRIRSRMHLISYTTVIGG